MKASEIVDKLKSVLLSAEDTAEVKAEELSQEEVNEIEVNAAEEVSPEQEAMEEEMPAEEPKVEYVSKDDFEKAMAEVKAMYEAIVAEMGSEEMEVEVPVEELSKEEEPQKEELSSQEPEVEPIAHTPEVEASKPQLHAFASRRPRNTMDVVYAKMFNK